jgi:hypothetical protein
MMAVVKDWCCTNIGCKCFVVVVGDDDVEFVDIIGVAAVLDPVAVVAVVAFVVVVVVAAVDE